MKKEKGKRNETKKRKQKERKRKERKIRISTADPVNDIDRYPADTVNVLTKTIYLNTLLLYK